MIDRRSLLAAAAATALPGAAAAQSCVINSLDGTVTATAGILCVASRRFVITGDLGRVAAYIAPMFPNTGIDKKRGTYQDLSDFNENGWVRAFEGADVVVHLAASLEDRLPELMRDTYMASANVLRACALHKVPLVIFASSLWASPLSGHKTIRSVQPTTYYGASKRNAEAMMAAHAAETGAATVAIRLGTVPPIGTPIAETDSAWLPWVRMSDDQVKTQNQLKDQDEVSYCCLGVLCTVAGAKWKKDPQDNLVAIIDGKPASKPGYEVLQPAFLRKVGLTKQRQMILTNMNDGSGVPEHDFEQIADYIEKYL